MRILVICLLIVASAACLKQKDPQGSSTFFASLPIVKVESPDSVAMGQNIESRVFVSLPSTSGQVRLHSFETRQNAIREFDIGALGYFENWNPAITQNVVWSSDSTVKIPTATAGQYILRFYSGQTLSKTDTVIVTQ